MANIKDIDKEINTFPFMDGDQAGDDELLNENPNNSNLNTSGLPGKPLVPGHLSPPRSQKKKLRTREKIAKLVAEGSKKYPVYLKLVHTGDSDFSDSDDSTLERIAKTRKEDTQKKESVLTQQNKELGTRQMKEKEKQSKIIQAPSPITPGEEKKDPVKATPTSDKAAGTNSLYYCSNCVLLLFGVLSTGKLVWYYFVRCLPSLVTWLHILQIMLVRWHLHEYLFGYRHVKSQAIGTL